MLKFVPFLYKDCIALPNFARSFNKLYSSCKDVKDIAMAIFYFNSATKATDTNCAKEKLYKERDIDDDTCVISDEPIAVLYRLFDLKEYHF